MTRYELKKIEAKIQDYLNGRGETVEVRLGFMRKPKKAEFYGTSVKRYIRSQVGQDVEYYNIIGSIYINHRDIDSSDRLAQVLAHEVSHITDDSKKMKEAIYNLMVDYFAEKGGE